MLGTEIVKQGQLFLEAALYGALLSLLYDCLRMVRRVFRHGVFLVAVEDLLFWLFWAFEMFGFMYRQNDGVIRGFLICGAALGMILYSVLVSRYVVGAGTAFMRGVLRFLRCVFGVASAPFRRLGHFLQTRIGKRYERWTKHFLQKKKNSTDKILRFRLSRQASILQEEMDGHDEILHSKSFHQESVLRGAETPRRDVAEKGKKKF